jgi:hypothetical protein
MVHALLEAHRVLVPGGILLDLRPAIVHREVGIARAGRYQRVGRMHERFHDDRAASQAVADVVRQGLLKPAGRIRFGCNRYLDSPRELAAWWDEFVRKGKLPPHDRLVQSIERAFLAAPAGTRVVVKGPVDLKVLYKQTSGSR